MLFLIYLLSSHSLTNSKNNFTILNISHLFVQQQLRTSPESTANYSLLKKKLMNNNDENNVFIDEYMWYNIASLSY